MAEHMPPRYSPKDIEEKWQRFWEEQGVYRFDREDCSKPTYSINTPPPYPSGDFHVGNALNHTYIDFVARYKRMRGYNVLFPQGWDCHGLPTEVRVERTVGKKKSEFQLWEFYDLCAQFTEKWIESMKKAIKSLGCSIDWTTEYKTMNPDYWKRTQLSFVLLYEKGLAYRREHPVHWCPRCETALAEAEVEYREIARKLYYFIFEGEKGPIEVASTRPELLGACVALLVHPDDDRYRDLVGGKAKVPIYGRKIPILADPEVDPSFGTGVVMVCTYGDKTDVKWQRKYKLPLVKLIDEKGRLTLNAGPLAGLLVEQAREKIVTLLNEKGFLRKVEDITSSIGTCWRCHTPVEIIVKEQWFLKTKEFAEQVLRAADEILWIPQHAKKRLEDWVRSLDWDWPISRQRVFATPIPVWYCERGHIIVAKPDWLPIDPRRDKPPIEKCPECGGALRPETDVMDTWMDSSISAAVHAGWPDSFDERLLPADLQPNGYDIIRTWDYYLVVRGLMLFGKPQFKSALINGMVLGADGRMMHKSYGNYVSLSEVIEKYGADAFRLWVAMAASTGSDVRFRWEGLEYARRFLVKLWNAARFTQMVTADYQQPQEVSLRLPDRWILGLLDQVINRVTEAMERCEFIMAATALTEFTWHKLCDHYLEAIKHRLSTSDGEDKAAVQSVLRTVFLKLLQMFSVFTPHICEELYARLFNGKPWRSITISPWPSAEHRYDKDVKRGEVLMETIASIRRTKHDLKLPLNAPLSKVKIYAGEYCDALKEGESDIKGTLKIAKLTIAGEGRGKYVVEEYPQISYDLEA